MNYEWLLFQWLKQASISLCKVVCFVYFYILHNIPPFLETEWLLVTDVSFHFKPKHLISPFILLQIRLFLAGLRATDAKNYYFGHYLLFLRYPKEQ